jgi:hypothetical protein
MPELLCARPHIKTVNFASGRFVVAVEAGLRIGTKEGVRQLEFGDEVPVGALDTEALRCLYEVLSPHPIETLEYAMTIPELREAHARRSGVDGAPEGPGVPESGDEASDGTGEPPESGDEEEEEQESKTSPPEALDRLTRKQLSDLCYKKGLRTSGSKDDLRARLLAAVLG